MNLPLALLITGGSVALVYQGITDPAGGIMGALSRTLAGTPAVAHGTTSQAAAAAAVAAAPTDTTGYAAANSPGGSVYNSQVPAAARGGSAVVTEAQKWIGVPYQFGGNTHAGVDCSGLTTACLAAAGVALPRTAAAQEVSKLGRTVSASTAAPGDLVFYGLPAYHVAIFIGGGQQIAAPHAGGVVEVEAVKPTVAMFRRFT